MNKTNTILKPYLRKFILKTHPDFFHSDTIKKQTNATSLQKLYSILQPEPNSTALKPITCKLEFFTKDQKKKATSLFETNGSEWSKTNSFFQLCKQVDISILQSDLDLVNDMILKETVKPHKEQYKSLTKEFAERLYKQHNTSKNSKEWEPKQILNHKLVMFDPKVNKKVEAQKLSSWLPQLNPEKWWGRVPVMIISAHSELPPKESTKGILVIKDDMELKDIKQCLNTVIYA